MKILVPVKQTIDYNVKVQIKPDGSGVETANVKHSINPFDEIALEEAIRLKERSTADQVHAVTIGPAKCTEVLRHALAMGADEATHITSDNHVQPLQIAKILKIIALSYSADLIIMGKQAIDDDFNQTGQMLAALLNWPQATFASKLDVEQDHHHALVTRETDGGEEIFRLPLPAVVTADLRLNQPRYIALPNLMRAKSKLIATIPLESLDIQDKARITIRNVEPPPTRKQGQAVTTTEELFKRLNEQGAWE